MLSLQCVEYRLTSGDHHRLPYKKRFEGVTILGLPVSVCSELHLLSDSCQVAKGKAVGWSRYVTVFPSLFPVAAPADDLRVGSGMAGVACCQMPRVQAAVGLNSKLGDIKRIIVTFPGDENLTSVASATQAHVIPVAASMTGCLEACDTCTVIQTSCWITMLSMSRRY